jgi:ankyrin repeat protein
MMRIRLDIQSISAVTSQSSKERVDAYSNFMTTLAGVDERLANVEAMLRAQTEQVKRSQFLQVGLSYRMPPARRKLSSTMSKSFLGATSAEGVGIRMTPRSLLCKPGCACKCHVRVKASTPAVLNRLLGQLFIGYSGLPALGPECNIDSCQKLRSTHLSLEYWFPMEFLTSKIIRLQIGYQPTTGTLLQLDTLRRVPDTAQCVNYALSGNIEGLKYLFYRGLASPRDVSSTRGYSLLRWAIYGKQYKTGRFLLHAGADPDYRPISANDNSPRNKACHFLLEGGLPDADAEALQALTLGGHFEDFVDSSNFTQVHRIVLGLSLNNLEERLLRHPEEINAVDAMGRTPLAWAAARGDSRVVIALLQHGADPNIIDVQLSGPVSNAAARGHTICVRLLLEAGADPDDTLPPGVKKGSPLNVAARGATDVVLLKSLLDFGANPDSCGVDGITALIHAARIDNSSFAVLLLESGADVNVVSTSGSTPLTTAVTHNSHNVLRLIIERWHEYTDCPRLKSQSLLHIVAQYADVETLNILANSDHLRMSYDRHYALADFKDLLDKRPDISQDILSAFNELLNIINYMPDPRQGVEGLMEGGFFSCPPSRANSDLENHEQFHSFCKHPTSLSDAWDEKDVESAHSMHESDDSFEDALDGL